MFKFKGISSTDMQVIIEEEEHFIARAAQRYETIEIEGRNGAIFNELGYSYVERPIYVQCLNINKIDQILAWLNGEGEFEYKGRKTIARFYSQLDPQRDSCIRIIDTNFIRDPFWNKATEEYQTIKESKIKNSNGNPIHLTDSSNMSLIYRLNGGDRQESRNGSNILNLKDWTITEQPRIEIVGNIEENSVQFKTTETTASVGYYLRLKGTLHAGTYYFQRKFETIEDGLDGNNYGNAFIAKADWSKEYCRLLPSDNKKSFIVEEETEVYLTLVIKGSGDTGTDEREIKYYDLMLSTEDKEYQPYGAMPSPNYPSNVETVGNNVNEFDNSAEIVKKYIDASGNEVEIVNESFYKQILIPKTNKYIMSFKEKVGSGYVRFSYYNGDTFISREIGNTNNYIFTVPEGTTKIDIRKDTETNYFTELKIEQGTKATPYSPYNQGSVEIKKINKNFINLQEKTTEWSGATITRNKNKITFTGGSNGTSAMNYTCEEINLKLKAGINLTYSSKYIKGNYTGGQTYYNIKLFYSDGTSEMLQMYRNYTDVKADKIVKKTLSKDLISYYIYGSTYEVKGLTTELVYEFQLEIGNEATEIVESESQTKILPIQEEMLEDDYIEDVEYHTWGKVILTGNEGWTLQPNAAIFSTTNLLSNAKLPQNNSTPAEIYCNYFKADSYNNVWTNHTTDNIIGLNSDGTSNPRIYASQFTTTEEFKAWLQEKYNSGNPIVVYYKLATPKSLPLTEEQKEALEGINTYENVTNISVDNELATLDVEYTAETTEKITNEGNIYSEPIIRLEKTQTEAVELTINDIRFKYNFNNDECVEINCEEKTVEYEGLNRNRQIEIGYDFPKLKVGENEIIMHSGDCVIKVLRKDRWL